MNGHSRKRGSKWEVVLELGEQAAQRCPTCVDGRGRGRRHWTDKGRLDACPTCGGELEDMTARRQIVLPERYRTKREADEALIRALAAELSGLFVEPDKITLGEFLTNHWLPSLRGSVRETTLIAYRGHVRRYLVPSLGDVPLRKLTATGINRFHATLRETPRRPRGAVDSPRSSEESGDARDATEDAEPAPATPLSERTRRHIHVTLVIALNAAVRQGLLAVNPATRATAPQRRDTGVMHTWSSAELHSFLSATREDRLFALWRLLAVTGARRGEALGLKWPDVDLDGGRITIQRSRVLAGGEVLEHPPKTRAGRRAVPLDPATVAALKAWKAQQAAERLEWGAAWVGSVPPGEGYVFTQGNGAPLHPGAVTKAFYRASAQADLPRIRLHDLRHTSATLALAAGVHAKVVQERLGHATISQTLDTYSHTTPSLHEGAAETLAAVIDGDG